MFLTKHYYCSKLGGYKCNFYETGLFIKHFSPIISSGIQVVAQNGEKSAHAQ